MIVCSFLWTKDWKVSDRQTYTDRQIYLMSSCQRLREVTRLCHSGHVNRFCYLLTYLL